MNTSTSSNVPAPSKTHHQQIQHIDADLNQECDDPAAAIGETGKHSDLILGTAIAM